MSKQVEHFWIQGGSYELIVMAQGGSWEIIIGELRWHE